MIGSAPNRASGFKAVLEISSPNAVLHWIFLSDPSTPNYLTTLLGRSDHLAALYLGDVTFGELAPDFEIVTEKPTLPVTQAFFHALCDPH